MKLEHQKTALIYEIKKIITESGIEDNGFSQNFRMFVRNDLVNLCMDIRMAETQKEIKNMIWSTGSIPMFRLYNEQFDIELPVTSTKPIFTLRRRSF